VRSDGFWDFVNPPRRILTVNFLLDDFGEMNTVSLREIYLPANNVTVPSYKIEKSSSPLGENFLRALLVALLQYTKYLNFF
jgi:hypothetical protein